MIDEMPNSIGVREALEITIKLFKEVQTERDRYKTALEYYANHESVIKEAYHSNEAGQITCVHTFINHVAKEALSPSSTATTEEK